MSADELPSCCLNPQLVLLFALVIPVSPCLVEVDTHRDRVLSSWTKHVWHVKSDVGNGSVSMQLSMCRHWCAVFYAAVMSPPLCGMIFAFLARSTFSSWFMRGSPPELLSVG